MKDTTTSTDPQAPHQNDGPVRNTPAGPDWSRLEFAPRRRDDPSDEIPPSIGRALMAIMRFLMLRT